jgi:ankyrin repeat protein
MAPVKRLTVAAILWLLTVLPVAAEIPVSVKRALAVRDYPVALAWLDAHSGDPDAAFELGRLYRLGKGVDRDLDRMAALFEVAATGGHREAAYLLGKHLERRGEPDGAVRWMQQAADEGQEGALRWLEERQMDRGIGPDLLADLHSGRTPPLTASRDSLAVLDSGDRTLLIIAAEIGADRWVNFLLNAGVPLDARDRYGTTALNAALAGEHFRIARHLLEAGADPTLATTDGTTALHRAVAGEDLETIRLLLGAGADRDAKNGAGWSPRELAVRGGNPSVQRLLGEASSSAPQWQASPDADTAFARLLEAVRRGDGERVRALLAERWRPELLRRDSGQVLHLALSREDPALLAALIEAGFDVHGLDENGRSLLLSATSAGCFACVESLIGAGADLNQRDAQGRTALLLATRQDQQEIARRLVDAGAGLDLQDAGRRTALWWSCRNADPSLATRLLDAGARPLVDAAGRNPLHVAGAADQPLLVARLARMVDIEAQTGSGNTALLLAAHEGAVGSVETLLEAGAAVEHRNGSGDTALILAVRGGHPAVAERLLRAGANPRTRNEQFESAAELIADRSGPQWRVVRKLADDHMLGLLGALDR